MTPRSKSTPLRDMALYEQMIDHGIAAGDRRFRTIDHVTARRIALMLVPRSQEDPKLMRGLIRFAKSGYITEGLRDQVRPQARSPRHPNHTYAAKLLQYAMARGASRGSIGNDFGATCDYRPQRTGDEPTPLACGNAEKEGSGMTHAPGVIFKIPTNLRNRAAARPLARGLTAERWGSRRNGVTAATSPSWLWVAWRWYRPVSCSYRVAARRLQAAGYVGRGQLLRRRGAQGLITGCQT